MRTQRSADEPGIAGRSVVPAARSGGRGLPSNRGTRPARRRTVRASERGSATFPALLLVIVCAGVAASSVIANVASTREAETVLSRERAFQAAEAGVDWAVTRMRITRSRVPTDEVEPGTLDGTASWELRYLRGTADGLDQNGDGEADDAGEADFSTIRSTGISGGVRRTLEVVVRKAAEIPTFPGAALINTDVPTLDLNGNSFTISGAEHLLDGTADPLRPAKWAVASLGDPSTLADQVASRQVDQLTGQGGLPSAGQAAPIDLATLVARAMQAATVVLEPGTHTNGDWGTPTPDGVAVVACRGDLHLSGGSAGAGVLVVEGDLDISGGLEWVGIILVTNRINLVGGGGGTRLVGAMVVGDELREGLRATGTVDLLYSSDAVALASLGLSLPFVLSWREVGNP